MSDAPTGNFAPDNGGRPSAFLLSLGLIALGTLVLIVVALAFLAFRDPANASSSLSGITSWVSNLPPLRQARLQREADSAWQAGDWAASIERLTELCALETGPEDLTTQLGLARFLEGQRLAQLDDMTEALRQYDLASALLPDQPAVRSARTLLANYVGGREACRRGDWGAAASLLQPAFDLNSGFRDVADLLYAARVQLGLGYEKAGQLKLARDEYEAALRAGYDGPDAKAGLDRVTVVLTAPSAPSKRVLVSISQQKMHLYENGEAIHTWVCSTGEPGRDTAVGHYKIQTKMPVAYGGTWNLDLPFWMGIDYAGAIENGIHAPPIDRSTGQKLWEGLLGRRISYGCVILASENARTLYDWAPLGTPVDIEP